MIKNETHKTNTFRSNRLKLCLRRLTLSLTCLGQFISPKICEYNRNRRWIFRVFFARTSLPPLCTSHFANIFAAKQTKLLHFNLGLKFIFHLKILFNALCVLDTLLSTKCETKDELFDSAVYNFSFFSLFLSFYIFYFETILRPIQLWAICWCEQSI